MVVGFSIHFGIEPGDILCGNRAVDMCAYNHEVTLADPYPEAGGEATEDDCTDSESDELESCDADALKETGSIVLGGVELREGRS